MNRGLMDKARAVLRQWIETTEPGDRVASVSSLSAAAGGLATASTVAVLKEAIDDGWIFSTRGPKGGYWRTTKELTPGLIETLSLLEFHLKGALTSLQSLRRLVEE